MESLKIVWWQGLDECLVISLIEGEGGVAEESHMGISGHLG